MLCMLQRHVGLSRPFNVNKIYSFIHSVWYWGLCPQRVLLHFKKLKEGGATLSGTVDKPLKFACLKYSWLYKLRVEPFLVDKANYHNGELLPLMTSVCVRA